VELISNFLQQSITFFAIMDPIGAISVQFIVNDIVYLAKSYMGA